MQQAAGGPGGLPGGPPGAPGLPPALAGMPGLPPSSAAGLLSLAGHGIPGLPPTSLQQLMARHEHMKVVFSTKLILIFMGHFIIKCPS